MANLLVEAKLLAKNAGIKCIGVTWGFGAREEVELADYIVHNPKMIKEIILSI